MDSLKALNEFLGQEPWHQGFWRKHSTKVNIAVIVITIIFAIIVGELPVNDFHPAVLPW